jgi:hypothetical protein
VVSLLYWYTPVKIHPMSREILIVCFAILVFILPFVGIPGAWKTPLYVIAGVCIAGLALIVRQERLWFLQRKRKTDGYTEHMPEQVTGAEHAETSQQ